MRAALEAAGPHTALRLLQGRLAEIWKPQKDARAGMMATARHGRRAASPAPGTALAGHGRHDLGAMSGALRLSRLVSSFSAQQVTLAIFAEFLRAHGVLPRVPEYSLAQQDAVQKCAFIAQRAFGLNLDYRYHLHEYGTFSSLLAADYYDLVKSGARSGEAFGPLRPDAKRFLSLVSGKDAKWLRLASTMVHEMGSCPDASLLGRVAGISADYDERLARDVLESLRSALQNACGQSEGAAE